MMKKVVKSSKLSKSITAPGFAMIRALPEDLYNNLIHGRYKNFTGKYKSETFTKIEDIPELKDLINFIRQDIKAPLPEGTPITVQIGIYTRTACTYMDPPSESCGFRVLFNLGADETYQMKSIYTHKGQTVNSGLEDKAQHMEANSYCIMGPYSMSDYKIYVDGDPLVVIPQMHPKESPKAPKPRPGNYKRITIVLDYNLESEELLEQITDMAMNNSPKIKATPGMSQKKIDEQIEIAKKKLSNHPSQKSGASLLNAQLENKKSGPLSSSKTKGPDKSEIEKLMEDVMNSDEENKNEIEKLMDDVISS